MTEPPAGYRIRPRRESDDPHLLRIENAAGRLFAHHGYPQLADDGFDSVDAIAAMLDEGETFVAVTDADAPAGYAVAVPLGDGVHLRELSVDPAHGRRGLGAALVGAVVAAAERSGANAVSLTTFRAVPFNRPFYQRLGFVELPLADAVPALRSQFHAELPDGIDASERLLMVRRIPASPKANRA